MVWGSNPSETTTMTVEEILQLLDTLSHLVEVSKGKNDPKWEEYHNYYLYVCNDEKIKPLTKGTKHYKPNTNDIRDSKIDIILGN